eukprot:CCRYP_000605-RA/>CCRYP_000605-RA protein AED:0.08 eAED:0.08 QI:286/1/1/1/1/1/3/275/160
MWSTLARTSLRRAFNLASRSAPSSALRPACSGCGTPIRCASRFFSERPYAVDAPDGDHDLQEIEESSSWAKRTIDLASITEDADAITEMHQAVLGKQLFAVDGPDGEHDFEDVEEHLAGVHRIINSASVLEDPEEIKKDHQLEEEIRRQAVERSFDNAKY